jgi:hypothetical protein
MGFHEGWAKGSTISSSTRSRCSPCR